MSMFNGEGLVIDSFAGGGGASMGIEQAIGRPVDVAINHDRFAVAMHEANHPATRHYHQDIWQVRPRQVTKGRPVALFWASPDCRHFSKAKGGAPVSPQVRDLAWVVIEWARDVHPDVIMLENVEEFQQWGPLTEDNMPDKSRRGETFNEWAGQLRSLGYEVEWRELRAMDYGAPTTRKRLFVIARCDGKPIRWPSPTHGPGLLPYRTAAECIDFWLPCPSIFDRAKPLADATLRRIANGIRRYVVEAAEPFIVNLTHGGRVEPVSQPFATITGAHRGEKALVSPYLLRTAYKQANGSYVNSVDKPFRTLTTQQDGLSLVAPFLAKHYGDQGQRPGIPLDEPMSTVTAVDHHGLVAPFLASITHNKGGDGAISAGDAPVRTITTSKGGEQALVAPTLVQTGYGEREGQAPRSLDIESPLGTVVAQGNKHALVSSFLSKLYGTTTGQDEREPMPTITAGGGHIAEVRAFLHDFYKSPTDGYPLQSPLRTLTTHERFGLVYVQGQPYEIVDIGLRMLTPRELFRAQGFPEGYIIDLAVDGKRLTKTVQIRLCGNSVCPPAARALVEANVGRLGQQEMWAGHETSGALALAGGQ